MNNINKNIKIGFLAIACLLAFNACQDMLDTNSSLIATEDEYEITNTKEANSALNGVFSEFVAIADRYVLMGELRGDLMTTSTFATSEIQDINRFQVSEESEYADKHDYYKVINNCNFLLQKMDTALVMQNEKVLLPYHLLAKSLRAWTYFQLGQIYGKVNYFTEPILDFEASLVQYPEKQLDELVDILIEELKPYLAVSANWDFGNLFSVQIFLADLYLYKNDYRMAASLYYEEIYNSRILVRDNANRWTNTNMEALSVLMHSETYSNEVLTEIPGFTSIRNIHSHLVNLSYNDRASILPSDNYFRFMSEALYLHETSSGVAAAPSGDLRGMIQGNNIQMGDAYNYVNVKGDQELLIWKYYIGSNIEFEGVDPENGLLPDELLIRRTIPIYRIPHLYLRFAEALNRLEKPTLAFAVLKYGLSYATVGDPLTGKVNPNELGETFTQFPLATFFDDNKSMTARGRGAGIPVDTTFFIIPELPAKQDSILWVEDRILEEMAAETPFEGNRFFDLLRVSRRRSNHPAYMAEKVAAKYPNQEEMKTKLMNPDNWFLP